MNRGYNYDIVLKGKKELIFCTKLLFCRQIPCGLPAVLILILLPPKKYLKNQLFCSYSLVIYGKKYYNIRNRSRRKKNEKKYNNFEGGLS